MKHRLLVAAFFAAVAVAGQCTASGGKIVLDFDPHAFARWVTSPPQAYLIGTAAYAIAGMITALAASRLARGNARIRADVVLLWPFVAAALMLYGVGRAFVCACQSIAAACGRKRGAPHGDAAPEPPPQPIMGFVPGALEVTQVGEHRFRVRDPHDGARLGTIEATIDGKWRDLPQRVAVSPALEDLLRDCARAFGKDVRAKDLLPLLYRMKDAVVRGDAPICAAIERLRAIADREDPPAPRPPHVPGPAAPAAPAAGTEAGTDFNETNAEIHRMANELGLDCATRTTDGKNRWTFARRTPNGGRVELGIYFSASDARDFLAGYRQGQHKEGA